MSLPINLPKRGLSKDEAAEYCGVSSNTLGRHGPSPTKIGDRTIYDRRVLDRWLDGLAGWISGSITAGAPDIPEEALLEAIHARQATIRRTSQLGFSSARLQHLTETYQGYVDRGELPGAVLLIARGEKIAYLQAVGYQDREKKTPMKVDAIFRLASMTKPIVSVAAMMLVEEGKLDLLAPVAQYLPEFKDLKVGVEQADIVGGKRALTLEPQRRPMIVQDLLRHTSGLVYGQNGDDLVHKAYVDANVADRGQKSKSPSVVCN